MNRLTYAPPPHSHPLSWTLSSLDWNDQVYRRRSHRYGTAKPPILLAHY